MIAVPNPPPPLPEILISIVPSLERTTVLPDPIKLSVLATPTDVPPELIPMIPPDSTSRVPVTFKLP